MKRIILIIFLFSFITSNSQISKKLKDGTKSFDNYEIFNAMSEKNDSISKLLNKKATEEELVYLSLNGKNTFTKGIAIQTLIKNKSNTIFNIYDAFIDSKDSVVYSTGCLSTKFSFPSFVFQEIVFSNKYSQDEQILNKEILVRKILQKKPPNINLLQSISFWIPQNEEFYEQIRNIVIEQKSTSLLVTLAKYRKEDDVELIKSFGEDALPAIEEFPHQEFLEILQKNIKFDEYQYMFALAKFCTPKAVVIVEKALKLKIDATQNRDCENYCLNAIYNQIEMNNCELFFPALEELWITNKIISYNILDNYKKHHSDLETENFLFEGLMLDGEAEIIHKNMYAEINSFEDIESGMEWNSAAKLSYILKKLKNYSNRKYLLALEHSIMEMSDINMPYFVKDFDDKKSLLLVKAAFLEKLKTNENAYGLFSIMDAIKLLNDSDTFKKGFAIVKHRDKEFENFPIWEEEYQRFLKENHSKIK
ncbi:MAG: hypothetical protein ACOH1O_01375 [Flavobacterium sp.]